MERGDFFGDRLFSNFSRHKTNGAPLTRDESSASYVIIRHNIRTYLSAGVVGVIRGRQNADRELKSYEASQSAADHHEGWRYFLEKTELKAGTDPAEATILRQTELETRESKAVQETDVLSVRRGLFGSNP